MTKRTKPVKSTAGVSLIELIIAVALSTVVLVGIFSVMTSMVQTQVEGGRKGSVTAWSLASLKSMSTDIASASSLVYPDSNSADHLTSADMLVVCTNWSQKSGDRIDATSNNQILYFCYDGTRLWRGATDAATNTACPSPSGYSPPLCSAIPNANAIATSVYRGDAKTSNSAPVFYPSAGTLGAVRLNFIVGNPSQGTVSGGGTADFKNPQSLKFDTKVQMENWSSAN